jgi:two-component system sensor histidine kinase AlgZ
MARGLVRHLLSLAVGGLLVLGAPRRCRPHREARLQALQARVMHFLFNSINAVLSSFAPIRGGRDGARGHGRSVPRAHARQSRPRTLADEIELCREYLALEKLRLGDRLVVEWHLNSMPADALVPPLVLQPLLENAIYHGIEPSSAPGVVSINIFYKGGEVHAILRNPYQANGGEHHAGNKMALANVRERLALHFDAEGALESKVMRDAYEVHIRMPYRTALPAPRPSTDATASAERRGENGDSAVRRVAIAGTTGTLAGTARELPRG